MTHLKSFKVLRLPGRNGEWIDMYYGLSTGEQQNLYLQTSGYVETTVNDLMDAITDIAEVEKTLSRRIDELARRMGEPKKRA